MKKAYFAVVVATVTAHLAYLLYLPSGGFLALRWRRTFWLHLPTVCWGVGVVAMDFACPLTALEDWARAGAGMDPLPRTGFIGRYFPGAVCQVDRTGTAQTFAFLAAAVSWIALAIQWAAEGDPTPLRRSGHRTRRDDLLRPRRDQLA